MFSGGMPGPASEAYSCGDVANGKHSLCLWLTDRDCCLLLGGDSVKSEGQMV